MENNELISLWQRYKLNEHVEDRNQLFLYYSAWIRKISSAQFSRYGGALVEWNDCVQNASIALIQSIDRFDIGRGVPFEAFAYPRIKGAIVSGAVHAKKDQQKKMVWEFSANNMDHVGESELAEDAFDLFVDSVVDVAFGKLLEITSYRSKELVSNPLDIYISSVEEEKIANSVEMLPDDLRYIVVAHYRHYLSFTQIAEEINLSRSRVSQLHQKALKKIRLFYEMN